MLINNLSNRMEIKSVFKPIIYSILGLIGLVIIIIPYTSYEEAYFVDEAYYITMRDSIEEGYKPYITELIVAEKSFQASIERKNYYLSFKPYSDSLVLARNKISILSDSAKIKAIDKALNKLENEKSEFEYKLGIKYSLDEIPKDILEKKVIDIQDTLSMDKYVAIVANQIRNPDNLSTIPDVKISQLNIQKINRQDKESYWIVGLIIVGIVVFMLLMEKGTLPLHLAPLKFGSFALFFGLAIFLAVKSFYSLNNDIKFKDIFNIRQLKVREKLLQIKNLQVEYLSTHNEYANSWDKLVEFGKNDSVEIVRYLVDKDDTASVNTALRNNDPITDTTYLPVDIKVFGRNHNIVIDSLQFVPFTKKIFSLKTIQSKNQNDRDISFIEVKTKKKTFVDMLDIYPENFDEENYIKIGSLTEPTTDGNW